VPRQRLIAAALFLYQGSPLLFLVEHLFEDIDAARINIHINQIAVAVYQTVGWIAIYANELFNPKRSLEKISSKM